MAGRSSSGGGQGSVIEVFTEILQLLTQAKLMPDAPAHMQVISALEQGILQYIQTTRQATRQQAIQGGQQGPGGQPQQQPGMGGPPGAGGAPGGGMGGPGGSPGGSPMPPRQIAPGGGPGMSGFGTPNMDEMRRTLAGPAAVGGS